MMVRLRKFALFAASLAMIATLFGSAGMATAQDEASFPVNIRFFNAMTALDTVDVYINGSSNDSRVASGLGYGEVSDVFTGTAPATSVLIKTDINLGFDRYLFETIVPTEAGKEYLVVISDLVLIPTEFNQIGLAPDMARARVLNAAAQSPSLDVYASMAGDMASPASAEPIVTDLGFGRITDAGDLAAGSYDVTATASGTDTVAVEASGVAMDAGQVYAVVIYGKPGDTDTPLSITTISVPATS